MALAFLSSYKVPKYRCIITEMKKICVIGAGSSGLTAIKACKEDNLQVVCYERSDTFGGIWSYHSEDIEGLPSVMRTTIINTSKEMSAFSDFPPPKDFANFMHNTSMMKYFRMYAEKFDLLRHILYQHEVTNVDKAADYDTTGRWVVTVRDLITESFTTETFDGVMLCSGHHIYPHIPEFEGMDKFQGTVMHTHSLKSSDGFEGKNVLVIGVGNSGVDAAVEISKVSKKLYLSTRSGSWIFSRLGPFGIPYDILLQKRFFYMLMNNDFLGISDAAIQFMLNLKFDHAKYGLKPKFQPLHAHFTINDALPNCVLSGTVVVKNTVDRFAKDGVIFVGEEDVTDIDTVIFATGYDFKFPFLKEDIFMADKHNTDLYKYVFPSKLRHPSLAFIAIIQPLGAMFPLAEAQCRWYTQLMTGKVQLPSEENMKKEVEDRRIKVSRQFGESPRHANEVFFVNYMDELCSEFGANPPLWKMAFTDPMLYLACYFGPCVPYQYRLQGPHAWDGARDAILSVWNRIDEPLKTFGKD